jgi:hypothetical protein
MVLQPNVPEMKSKNHVLLLFLLLLAAGLYAQKQPITYYLPDITYDANIPTPEAFLGWQVGEWHATHDQQLAYMRMLAAASPRILMTEYARSHEQRPLVYMTITSPDNHARLPQIKARHLALSDPDQSAKIDLKDNPTVLYQGFSIHGNEPSGGNAALLLAYYLAAGQGDEIEQLLKNTIILFDPCYNPDGFQRFSTWVNIHKNLNLTPDPQDREYSETWPGGRTNHYWFDLNRDWLPVQHPEGRGRIQTFHEWKPNVLTDHHEMGTNSTFFFMPGVPTRVHPITPPRNQALTEAIGNYHAKALDDIGSLYFSKEGYDDYYVGKGSTYPDVNGAIGILFEQGSSRGHVQESDNGLLTFAFTIRNQVKTGLSTYQACVGLREELLAFQRAFYQDAQREAKAEKRHGYIFGDDGDAARTRHLLDILLAHQVEVAPLTADIQAGNHAFKAGTSYVVPLRQRQYRFIKAVFDPIFDFQDSIFYDISTWVLPMAFNLPHAELATAPKTGPNLTAPPYPNPPAPARSEYAYMLPWDNFYAPRLAYYLMDKGLRLKVTTEPSVVDGTTYPQGTVVLPVANQADWDADAIHRAVVAGVQLTGVAMQPLSTGLSSEGPDVGSRAYATLRLPRVALLVGDGVTSYEAGSNWHLLDQRYHIPVTKLAADRVAGADLSRYNTIIMPNGNYRMGPVEAEKLKTWVANGGILVAQRSANRWCATHQLATVTERKPTADTQPRRPYSLLDTDSGSRALGGAIFNATVDLTHPLLYGYTRTDMPVFLQGSLFFEPSKNAYAAPMQFTDAPLLSGYAHPSSLDAIQTSAGIVVSGRGKGAVISLAFEPPFRAFWFGTSKILANALFFGHTIDGAAKEAGK